ncbi:MAG: M24 family metallopeptidase [Anaerolineae bacterium]
MEQGQSDDLRLRRRSRFYAWQTRQHCLELPFPHEEYAARVGKARSLMAARGLEALVICGDPGHPGDVRWIANWEPGTGNAFLFLPAQGEAVLVLHDEVPGYNLCATWVKDILPPTRGSGSLLKVRDDLLGLFRDHHVGRRLGVVGEAGLPLPVYQGLMDESPRLEMEDVTFAFVELRAVKSALEVEKIREAVRQSDAAMQAAVEMVCEGVPEKDVVAEALRVIFAEGGDGVAFNPLVVAGPRAAWKHAPPTSRPIQRGEPVYIDLGASYQGYCADLSRTVFLGKPTPEQARALEFALEATAAVKEAARPGIPAGRLAEVGDEVAARFGLPDKAWGAGHGLGCKLREEPLLDRANKLLLQPGMVVSIEPMCVCDLGTFVVEDDILITETGSEYLSHSPRRNWS